MLRSLLLTKIAAVAALAALAGCGTIPGVSRQGAAGITDVEIEWCEPESAGAPRYLCAVRWVDGKEKETVTLDVTLPDGARLAYASSGVKAFEAHELRAAVEEAISDDIKEVVPGIVDRVVDALLGI